MKSIRAQLLGWLLPGFVLVCVVAIIGVYFSAKQANEADLDARLGRLAGSARLALRNQANAGAGGTRTPGLRAFLAKEDFQSPGQYFELWTSDGVPERRSPNLGNADLPRPPELTRDAIRYDGTLENGERVRVSAMQYPQGGGSSPLAFAVALSRSEGEARLSRLLTDLVMGGVACCAVLCLLLVLALRFALRPLARVGEQAVAMGAASLHDRFAMEAMPLEIAPIVTRLNDLMARLEQGFERERRFSGYLAHELRTPLAAIRATSEVAAKWPEQSSPDDFHEIAQSAARLQHTVDSLLVLSRLETASADVTSQPVVLGPLVDECLALHMDRAKQRDLKFDLRLDPSPTLETDPRLLRIIITNLIANATEYAPAGSEIVIAAADGDPFLCITNLAPDLAAEDIPRLFDRLWRKDATRTDAAHAGLGLSIASSCAVALGFMLSAKLDGSGVLHMSLHREK
ncbi:MAG: HAMP domain-containing sensor histidine kinase [Prosthecobacter sp.]|nr:HAMP domain-containing sensor histidine kinase [Prosthecobacter sp.]